MREVRELLREIALATDRHIQVAARDLGIPSRNIAAIGVLRSAHSGLSASELGRALGLSAPATTALVDRLVASGHARRGVSPRDGRQIVITATDEALTQSQQRFEHVNARIDAALDNYSDHDRRLLVSMLGDINDAMAADTRPRGET